LKKLEEYRSYFPITQKYIYFNHASTAPLNTYSLGKTERYLEVLREEGEVGWDLLQEISDTTRRYVANLLKVESSEIALVQNTSIGINLIIESIKWEPDDEVVLVGYFPALLYPFRYNRHGIKVVEVSENKLEEAIGPKTRMVAVEWIDYFSGKRFDLERLSSLKQKYDFFVLVDAIQGLGAVPLYPKEFSVDFLVAGASKWLLGPQGIGILYIDQKAFDKLSKAFIGWLSCPWSGFSDFSHLPEPFNDARVFETGTKNYWGLSYLSGNLEMILDIGVEKIFSRLKGFLETLFEELTFADVITPKDPERRGGIFTFRLPNLSSLELHLALQREGIRTSLRNGFIRVSPHFYNTEDEVNTLINLLKRF
jgi:selenocysteine lyase/cysteine desulfurase